MSDVKGDPVLKVSIRTGAVGATTPEMVLDSNGTFTSKASAKTWPSPSFLIEMIDHAKHAADCRHRRLICTTDRPLISCADCETVWSLDGAVP